MTAKTAKKTEPSELQRKTMEVLKRAVAPLIKLRKTKESYPAPNRVSLDAYPTFSSREEDRAFDSIDSLLDEAGIKTKEFSVGVTIPTPDKSRSVTNISITLADKQ